MDPEIGGLEYAPPGFRTGLQGLGALAKTAKEMVHVMEGLLRNATRALWLMRNKEQKRDEEEYIYITAEDKRATAAPKEWRETHRIVHGLVDEETERGELGTITTDEGGKVPTKSCGDCGRTHDGRGQICKECGVKLPSGARQAQYPMRRKRFGRGEDNYWILMAQIGKTLARNEEEQEQWKRRETLWKMVVKTSKSRGRGRDTDAPAGGPRGPNSDDPTDEVYDNNDHDCNSNEDDDEDMEGNADEDTRGHKRTQEDTQGERKRIKMETSERRVEGVVVE